ncbi:discoidin domain-containing protein [Kitasatospora sp. NPDC090308]|uniref:discoidin domain-containing protein n=1 Tax=Kitasatospora sp. NPDC090308 TaxID=3364082 RepID=UPI0038240F95
MRRPLPGAGPRARTALLATTALLAAALAAPAAATVATAADTRGAAGARAADAGTAGATLPFAPWEAEAGTPTGGAAVVALTAAPTTPYSSAALEASGHAYVHLAATGQGVRWTNGTGGPVSAINVRESIPDSATGGGTTATLNLYVDGVFRQALNLNSRQSWFYEGGDGHYNGSNQNAADGDPRDFFDEAHTFVTGAPIAPGSTVELRKDAANTAAYYDIDVLDAENPPPPAARPAGSLSITDCGAVASTAPTNGSAVPDAVDSTAAIQSCIDQAQAQQRTLWIPPGTFYLRGTTGLTARDITIVGAGQWYSTVYRDIPLPNRTPLAALFNLTSTHVQGFHLDSNSTSRETVDGGGGAMDTTGTNWSADGIWSQHVESGYWASGTGGSVRNARVTAVWADGINVNNVSLGNSVGSDITADNNFVRGTGDDGMAVNSVNYNTDGNGNRTYYTPMARITMTHNTIVAPWGGKGIGVYGGSGHLIEHNLVSDTARYIGLGAGRFGVNGSDLLGATLNANTVVRSGGNGYGQGQPALHVGNGGDGQNTGVVDHVTVTGNTVLNALYDGVGLSASTNTLMRGNTVTAPGRNGFVVAPPFYPAPTGSATLTDNTVTGLSAAGATAYRNNSPAFTVTASGNSWGSGTGNPEAPYGGSPAAIPGTVQAEDYDTGGPGTGYFVNTVNGTANGYRADGVDLEVVTDTGGGYGLGWTSGGQWQRYTVDVATAGTYTVTLRYAAPAAVTGALHLANGTGADLTGAVTLPATGDWQTWGDATARLTLPAGRQVLTLVQDTGGWNLNHLRFAGTSTPPATDLAAGRPTAESSHADVYGSGNLTDGNRNSYWESANNALPQWAQVDLGTARQVSRAVLRLPAGWGARTQTLTLLGSTDGTAFTPLKSSSAYLFDPAADNTVTLAFPAAQVRYVRVQVTGNTGWPAGQLSELQLWQQ